MLSALNWISDCVFGLLKIAFIWIIIKTVVRYGKGTFKEILDTGLLRLKVAMAKSRLKDVQYLKQEESGEPPADDEPQKVEARIL